MANAGGSKNATLNKPGAAYAQKGGNDLESLMAKFNNSLAIQNLMKEVKIWSKKREIRLIWSAV